MLAPPTFVAAYFADTPLEQLRVATSRDGVHFHRTPATYKPPKGTVRDPSITRRAGRWWIAYTNRGWDPAANKFRHGESFGLASSRDLHHWRFERDVHPGLPHTDRVWAPEWVDGGILVAIQTRGTFRIYETHPHDYHWTRPVLLRGLPAAIDPAAARINGRWRIFFKRFDTDTIEEASAPALTGPYTEPHPVGFPAGWEGPSLLRTRRGWRLYADHYSEQTPTGPGQMYFASSVNAVTWGAPMRTTGAQLRHTTVIRLESMARRTSHRRRANHPRTRSWPARP